MKQISKRRSQSGCTAVLSTLLATSPLLTLAQQGAPAPAAPKNTNVYKSAFDKKYEIDMWSEAKPGKAPDGTRFLGPFVTDQSVFQTLPKLPPHRFVRLRFDLLVLQSWDGEKMENGVDTWQVSVQGGPLLFCTLFANHITVVDPKRIAKGHQAKMPKLQSFPDEYPFLAHKKGTGSSPRGAKLGYKFYRNDIDVHNSLYEIDLIFPHSGEDLVLHYDGHLSKNPTDEFWGLNNVVVDTIDAVTPLNDEQLKKLWETISGKEPVAAHKASWKVIAAGPKAAAFIEKNWQTLKNNRGKAPGGIDKALQAKFDATVKNLTSDEFVARIQAQTDLQALGKKCLPLIEKLLKTNKDPELRRALRTAQAKLTKANAVQSAVQHLDLVQSRVARINRLFETHANGYKITSSIEGKELSSDPIGAPADGYFPKDSSNQAVPRFTWHPKMGTEEWLQYEFPKAKTISQADVFWFEPHKDKTVLPTAWKLLYQAVDGSWKEVEKKGRYPIEPDEMNTVKFKSVTTKAARLVVQLPERSTAGIHEFRVSDGKSKQE